MRVFLLFCLCNFSSILSSSYGRHTPNRTLTFDLQFVNDLMRSGLGFDDLEPALVHRIVDLVVRAEHPVSPPAI